MAENVKTSFSFSLTILLVYYLSYDALSLEVVETEDAFNEELLIKRLPSGHINTFFQFTTILGSEDHDEVEDAFTHYNLFPKSFGQIVEKYHVRELHLTLSHGQWRHQTWGYPISSTPPGVELWVWFSTELDKNSVDKQWAGLANALSGQFCASLNFINQAVTASPELSFKPLGLWPKGNLNATKYLRYATLPRENVCTENLTPWKKLLPCESKAGLATLFNALVLYDASYHSLGIHLRSVCKDASCLRNTFELKQTLSSVYDPIIAGIQTGWSLRGLFSTSLYSACPLATTSSVLVDISGVSNGSRLTPDPHRIKDSKIGRNTFKFAVFDLKKLSFKDPFNIAIKYKEPIHRFKINHPHIHAHRFITGYGEESGGITCLLTNEHETKERKIIYFETIPWYVRVYLHTLKVELEGKVIKTEYFKYVPAKDRMRPAVIEMMLTLPPRKTVKYSIQFERTFLKWTEHPFDSHHGFYIGSAVISTILPEAVNLTGISERCSLLSRHCTNHDELFMRIHTEPLLIVLPTPDFSMPYNVICLTCTVIAIGFGSLYNLATRDFEVESKTSKTSIKDKIRNLIFKLCRKLPYRTSMETGNEYMEKKKQ